MLLGDLQSTSFSTQLPQEIFEDKAESKVDVYESHDFHPDNNMLSTSGNQTLEDLDFSSSDNYEPSSSGSETDSDSVVEYEHESVNKKVTEKRNLAKENPKKKIKNEEQWKRNIRKAKRIKGESYTGYRGIKKHPRPLLPIPCLEKRKHKCKDLVSEQQRQEIYAAFRGLSCSDDQRQFVCNHIEQNLKKRTTRNLEKSRKTYTCIYSFTVNGTKCIVCREFFKATLNVTDAFMRSSIKKRSSSGILTKDQRGKHRPANKLPEDAERFIRDHILSFPSVESHYCRKKSSKKYLDASLNISIMYRLYRDLCNGNSKPVTMEKYRQIFKEYNLGFFRPKKDQCKICLTQKNLTNEERAAQESEYKKHLKKKNAAREARDYDKKLAKENTSILSFNFDLQAVLSTPKGSAGQIFYLRKLAVYNLTVYNLGNQEVKCYLWDETQGKRGANEIASCVYDFIMLSHNRISSVRMMSDGCGGQQKNSIFATMCLELCINHPSLETVDHQFFEPGHTEMECDSIHSKVEKKSKHVPVYTPECWAQVIRDSRMSPQPFVVKTMMFDDFMDFKTFSMESFNFSQIPWRKVCSLRYIKGYQSKVFYKTDFAGEFTEVDCSKSIRNRGRPKQKITLEKAYKDTLPISEAKWKDLQKMCKDLTIPKVYHNFYQTLKTDKSVRDNLSEPDAQESDTDGE